MRFGGSQYEYGVRRWLFQRFKEGIGSLFGYHVYLVYDVDLVAGYVGRIVDLFSEVADFIDATIAGGVYFYDIGGAGFVYSFA